MNNLKYDDIPISTSTYFYATLVGLGLYASFFFLKRYILPLWRNKQYLRQVSNNVPLLEAVIWIAYILYSFMLLLDTNPITHIAFVIVFLGSSWMFFKDLIAGLVFKLTDKLKKNQLVQIDQQTGMIIVMGYLSLELELKTGEILVLPYGSVMGKKIIKPNPSEQIRSYTVEVEIPDFQYTIDTVSMLQELILYMPWSVITRDASVQVTERTTSGHLYRLVLYSIDEKYFPDMERSIREVIKRKLKTERVHNTSQKMALFR